MQVYRHRALLLAVLILQYSCAVFTPNRIERSITVSGNSLLLEYNSRLRTGNSGRCMQFVGVTVLELLYGDVQDATVSFEIKHNLAESPDSARIRRHSKFVLDDGIESEIELVRLKQDADYCWVIESINKTIGCTRGVTVDSDNVKTCL